MKNKKNAFVLIFTLVILSLVTILTQQLLKMVYVGSHFDQAMVDREHAEMLALGGINLAIAQLTEEKPKYEKLSAGRVRGKKTIDTEKEKQKKKKEFDEFLNRIIPNINRWQTFALSRNIDGIDGEVKICISCENGKININEAFDFEKKEFKPTYKKLLETVKFKGKNKTTGKFFRNITKYLKKRNRKLDDISELQTNVTPSIEKLFYTPPRQTENIKKAKPNDTLALYDIFTIWTDNDKIEALFLSDALCRILELRQPQAYDTKKRKEKYKTFIKNFNPETDQNSEQYWTSVRPLYEQKSSSKLTNLKIFSSKFEPTTYSVLSSGKVGTVKQQVVAIIKKITKPTNEKAKTKNNKQKEAKKEEVENTQKQSFKIIRLYWI